MMGMFGRGKRKTKAEKALEEMLNLHEQMEGMF
jgi:hypothetical protein